MHSAGFADESPGGVTAACVDPGTSDRAVLRMHGPWVQPSHDTAEIIAQLFEGTAVA